MRRQLALVSLAVSSLVVLAFLIPLATLVRNQAENRALNRAERDAQSIAAALAVAGASDAGAQITEELAAAVIEAFGTPEGLSIIFPDGAVVGVAQEESANLEQARGGAAFTAHVPGGAEVLVPVLVADVPEAGDTVVVRSFVPGDELSAGVTVAWLMLAGLGIFLVVVAVIAADRLGRSMVRPVTALSRAARTLGEGDLTTRIDPSGPEEVAEVGEAFNFLAGRLGALLSAERESVADLSHRLRTPLTALRLQAETLDNPQEAESLLADIDRMERAVDRMITEARRPADADGQDDVADLGSVVRHRADYWEVLAEEQGRICVIEVGEGEHLVPMSAEELGAIVDTLMENVFAHTPPGSDYALAVGTMPDGRALLVVEDDGPGFDDVSVLRRGESRGGSTGLGLDIVTRAAERSGGGLRITNAAGGGARIELTFGHPAVITPVSAQR